MAFIDHIVLNGLLVISAVTAIQLKFDDALTAQRGLGWPHSLQVTVGHEALMKLAINLENQESCEVVTPTGVMFNIASPPNDRFELWEGGCSLKVKKIEPNDTGRWRLTAKGDNTKIMGWTALHVREDTPTPSPPTITLPDGENEVKVDLSTEDNSYCLVAKPFSDSALVPGHCTVTLDRTTRAVQGKWDVLLGVPGKVSEVPLKRQVVVEAERLDFGYIHESSTNKLHLYCNILHSEKNITFCRFQRTSLPYGFNVVDGLSDGSHSYYGKGFLRRECGITIEKPSLDDSGTWRCTVGLKMWVGNQVREQPPMQALISVAASSRISRFYNDSADNKSNTVFVQENRMLTVSCRADASLKYCWFQHPNGSQFTPVQLVNEEQPFWYTGEGLAAGQCGITFRHVTHQESGLWRCHMGRKGQFGVEVTEDIQVRVTGALAANKKEVAASKGGTLTLYCHTANGNRPLDYCRFLSPSFVGINIDSSVTKENAILDRFFFTPGRSIDAGDCSLTIVNIQEDDIGNWTCAAVVNDEATESSDTIRVYLSTKPAPRYQAGVIGASVGAAVLILILVGFVLYKRGFIMLPLRRDQNNPPPSDAFSLQRMSTVTSTSRSSQSSSEFGQDLGPKRA
ncbi:unnamed protein product [Leptosia nina]|uniref:Immunoglobulin domain-containing protein n=1 Tax=Leptosia nina TaxID=320188 RepID=A0AAV1JU72_9NEOP